MDCGRGGDTGKLARIGDRGSDRPSPNEYLSLIIIAYYSNKFIKLPL